MKRKAITTVLFAMLLTALLSVSAFAEQYTYYGDGFNTVQYYDYWQYNNIADKSIGHTTISSGEKFTFLDINLTDAYKTVVVKSSYTNYDQYGNYINSGSKYLDTVNGSWGYTPCAMEEDWYIYQSYLDNVAATYQEIEIRVYDVPMVYWNPDDADSLEYKYYTYKMYFNYELGYTGGNICEQSTSNVQVDNWDTDIWDYFYKTTDAYGGVTNYIRIRDLAYILRGTAAEFDVKWIDEPAYGMKGVGLYPKADYTSPNGTELNSPFYGDQYYTVNTRNTYVNLEPTYLDSIILTDSNGGGHTYYKLRDIGSVCGFNVSWINGQIVINTNQAYSDYQ